MIFVDETFTAISKDRRAAFVGTRTGHQWCHCWSGRPGPEGLEELQRFGAMLGLKQSWIQLNSTVPHWDLTPTKRRFALRIGAREMSLRTWFKYRCLL